MDKMTLLIKPEEFNENILRTETSLTQKSYNNWLHKAVEAMFISSIGKIWHMMNGAYYWNYFDDFSTEVQYDFLKQLVNCI